jgi:hypothetical protein
MVFKKSYDLDAVHMVEENFRDRPYQPNFRGTVVRKTGGGVGNMKGI